MSLTLSLSSAVSGLNAAQTGLRTTSTNLANINTVGYARKETHQAVVSLNGSATGVEVSEIRRVTDRYLQTEALDSTSGRARLDALAEFLDRLQSAFGKPEADTGFAARFSQAMGLFDQLALEPTSSAQRQSIVSKLNALGADLERDAREVQKLRSEADRRIGADLAVANSAIRRIHELNIQVERARINLGDSGGLEDQRAAALAELAKVVDFDMQELPSGAIQVSLPGGQPLVDRYAWELQHATGGSVGPDSGFPAVTAHRVDAGTGLAVADGRVVDAAIQGGSVRGLLDLRDSILPRVGRDLGEFAGQLADGLNAVHNRYSAYPAPASLTGRDTGLLGADAQPFSGEVTVSAFDAAGVAIGSVVVDLDAATTIDDIVAQIDAGLAGLVEADFSAGRLSLTTGAGAAGVALVAGDPAPTVGGMGFAHFFGLNDLVQTSSPGNGVTGLTGAAAHGLGTTGAFTLALRGPNMQSAEVTIDLTTFAGTTVQDVVDAINTGFAGAATFALDGAGRLSMSTGTTTAGWQLHRASDTTQRGATGQSFTDLFALGQQNTQGRAIGFRVVDAIAQNPARLALADASGGRILGGDGRGAQALGDLAETRLDFAAAGSLPGQSTTLGDFAAQVIGAAAREAAAVRSQQADQTALATEINERLSSVEGVNLDEELARMIALQTAYNASARVISTVKEMLDTLVRL